MLEALDLSFSYSKSKALFEGLHISVLSNERLALQAPSGVGKTTLCRILAGYLNPTQGKVLCDGKLLPKKGLSPVQLIWQHPEKAVDPRLRMKKTLEEGGSIDTPLMHNLQEGLGIKKEWLTRFPHELSGGELQRICIARALATEPRFLIADEITTMLDALTQAHLWEFLLDQIERNNIGLVFVSHSPALTNRIATRVFDLNELS